MEDLSLHVLDIVENAVRAGSRNVGIALVEDRPRNLLTLTVVDDGSGMDAEIQRAAVGPFFTTKTGKRIGLGLPLLAHSAEAAGGGVVVASRPNEGTTVTATFQLNHLDRIPVGNLRETMRCLEAAHPEIAFDFVQTVVE